MVVAIAAGERGTEKEKNPSINLPYNDRPYRKYIYEKKNLLVMDYEISIIIYKYSHYQAIRIKTAALIFKMTSVFKKKAFLMDSACPII